MAVQKFCSGVDGERCGRLFTPARDDRGRCPACRAKLERAKRGRRRAQGYENPAWRKVSLELRKRFPVCQRCGRRPSIRAHHLHGLRPADPGGLDPANLVAVCESCHRLLHSTRKSAT